MDPRHQIIPEILEDPAVVLDMVLERGEQETNILQLLHYLQHQHRDKEMMEDLLDLHKLLLVEVEVLVDLVNLPQKEVVVDLVLLMFMHMVLDLQ